MLHFIASVDAIGALYEKCKKIVTKLMGMYDMINEPHKLFL